MPLSDCKVPGDNLAIHRFREVSQRVQPPSPVRRGSKMKMFWRSLSFLLTVICISGAVASAQIESGAIAGIVTDQSSAVIPNASVTITNLNTNAERKTHTSSAGVFNVTGLAPSTYQVTVSSGSFKPFTAKVEVTVASHATVDAKLSVATETIDVQVVAEGGTQVNTQTQELSQEINTQEVTQLPSLTRNAYDFIAIAGNVSGGDSAQGKSQNDTSYGVGYSINGQRSSGTEILLDGVENIELFGDTVGLQVPVDAVGQYRILTSNYQPEFGRAAGGVVNVVTASGTNKFHGTGWEFNRLSAYTANTFANDAANADAGSVVAPKGTYTRNEFGFVVTGPAIKNRVFFTGSTEWLRVRSSANIISVMPTSNLLANTAANTQAFFNAYGANKATFIKTYEFSDLTSTNPTGPLSKISGPLFGETVFSAPTDAGGGSPQNTYNVVGRVDWNISDKTQAYGRYVLYHEQLFSGADFNSPYSQYDVGEIDNNNAILGNITHEFSSSLLANLKASYSRINISNNYDKSLQNVPTLFVATNATIGGNYIQLPGFYDTNPGNGGLPYGGPQNVIQINPDLSWTKGRHSLKFGAQLIYIQSNRGYGAYAQAGEQLGGNEKTGLDNLVTGNVYSFKVAVDPKGATPCSKDYITGALTKTAGCEVTLPASSPSFARSDRFRDWAVYAQDAYTIDPRLTVNYGVRYEYFGVQHNSIPGLDSNFYYANNTASAANIRNGSVLTVPNGPIGSLWNPTYGAVSPRIGLAYDLFGNGRTSLRAGYGISYERNFGNVTFNVIQNPPNYATVVVNNVPVTNNNLGPLSGSSGSVALPPSSLRHVDQNIKTSQTQFWSAAIEHQVFANSVLGLEYSAARGTHLYDIKDTNGAGLGNLLLGDAGGSSGQLSRLNSHFTGINTRGSQGDSYYESLNVHFQSSNIAATGLGVTANYTFGHSLDDLSSTFSSTNNAFSLGYTEPFNPGFDHGNSDFDIRQRLTIAPIYVLPYFKGQHGLKGETLGGWQVTGIYTVRTGVPFTFFDSTNVNGGGDFSNVPRYAPSTAVSKKKYTGPSGAGSYLGGGEYLFGNLPAGTPISNPALGGISDFGPFPSNTLGRNAFTGPGAWNLDAAVSKRFPIKEGVNLEFRAEGYDLTNHHNFYQLMVNNDQGNYIDDNGSPLAPQILGKKGGVNGGASDERRFGQFALKLNF
jgi:hypothetical protein